MPIFRISIPISPSNRSSPLANRRDVYRWNRYTTLTAAERIWETTVATATPITPQPRAITASISRRILHTADTSRKYSVARLSPMERRIAATIL